ncbi:glutaminase A [Paenibacillus ginsengarvi]|uniref:Glutaminase n=1 Tax=Paenibacillus ginsengarvi TaxID=400777 RepID=A0A3B0BUT0_9BACL|nr:glutaminase A [Paenibacillus ginsengarvi]RKN77165.1 glutaminase A [Paenibacillus ginsengarvi]
MPTDFNQLTNQLPGLVELCRTYATEGRVASYIPELAHANPQTLGITLHHKSGSFTSAGESDTPFTLQSISKVFTLLLALMDRGEQAVFEKVGMEPTGDVFNSMLKLELVQPGKPFNPLINAGAIVISSLIGGDTPELKSQRILRFIRDLAGDDSPSFNESVYRSEAATANRNRSLAYFLKDNKVLDQDVEPTLEVYFKQCAIEVTCAHVARMGLILANDGSDPLSGREIVPKRYVRIAKSFMVTCGMYNASGEFAIQVGIPAKSGVAGGILALVPGELGIGIIGPALNDKGNSTAGVQLLKQLSEHYDWSMF